jgi:hypothetical protein
LPESSFISYSKWLIKNFFEWTMKYIHFFWKTFSSILFHFPQFLLRARMKDVASEGPSHNKHRYTSVPIPTFTCRMLQALVEWWLWRREICTVACNYLGYRKDLTFNSMALQGQVAQRLTGFYSNVDSDTAEFLERGSGNLNTLRRMKKNKK